MQTDADAPRSPPPAARELVLALEHLRGGMLLDRLKLGAMREHHAAAAFFQARPPRPPGPHARPSHACPRLPVKRQACRASFVPPSCGRRRCPAIAATASQETPLHTLLSCIPSSAVQVLSCILYMHHDGHLHRDLKPDNIMLASEWDPERDEATPPPVRPAPASPARAHRPDAGSGREGGGWRSEGEGC